MRASLEDLSVAGIGWAVFIALLGVACLTDLKTRRIPNSLVSVLAVCGVLAATASHGIMRGGGQAVAGAATGLAIWLPFWLLGMMGAGDVKLFAAGAAWLGPAQAVEGALFAGLCGGLLSLAYVVFKHGASHSAMRIAMGVSQPLALREVAPPTWERRLPYALAMTAGLLLAAWRPGTLF